MCGLSQVNLISMVQFQKKHTKLKLDYAHQEDSVMQFFKWVYTFQNCSAM